MYYEDVYFVNEEELEKAKYLPKFTKQEHRKAKIGAQSFPICCGITIVKDNANPGEVHMLLF